MALDKLVGNSLGTGAIANSLGYTPANKAGDTFTGAVVVSNTISVGNTTITGTANISGNSYVSGIGTFGTTTTGFASPLYAYKSVSNITSGYQEANSAAIFGKADATGDVSVFVGADQGTNKYGYVGSVSKGTAYVPLILQPVYGNVGIGANSMPNVSLDMGSRNDAMRLPIGTTAQRPTGNTGYVRYNSNNNIVEEYNGTRWLAGNYPGSSPHNAANSAVEIWQAGGRGKGFFWLNSPNGGIVQNFCDLDTLDENGQSGWILVAMFPMAQNWRDDGLSTRQSLNPYDLVMNQNDGTPQPDRKMWSANWGDYSMNKFRIHNAWSVTETGSNATMDWYFHYSTAIAWKQVWNWQTGTSNYMNDTSGDNNGNINASYHSGWPTPTNQAGTVSRTCLRGFNWAYNLKFGYQVGQRWNNLSDSSAGGTAQNTSYNWWAGLTQPHYTLGWGVGNDGSLAILPQGSSYTTAGQDCDVQNCKVGVDDGTGATMWSSTASASVTQTGLTDSYRSLYFWIK